MITRHESTLLILASLAISLFPTLAQGQSGSRRTGSGPADATKGLAVVELYTSQGCSSCPPADNVLRQIASQASRTNLPVYVLSFHVDYWNRLGWTDPYSDALYSQRQRAYAGAMRSNRVYTPQMIVNGTTEFVGSNRAKAKAVVKRSLGQASEATITATARHNESKRTIELDYQLTGRTKGRWLNVALVASPAANAVRRGENAGRRLTHVNVVRAFKSQAIDEKKATTTLPVPEVLDDAAVRLIAYVQDPKTLRIAGATEVCAASSR